MKYSNRLFFFILAIGIIGCEQINKSRMKSRTFKEVDLGTISDIPQLNEDYKEIIKVDNIKKNQLLSSELIKEFFYIPLESVDESLFVYCTDLEVYKEKIYLFDRLGTEKLYIFDEHGKFQKQIGKKGGAPFEFYLPKAIAIDYNKDLLVMYDNMKRKWMLHTLDGDFLSSENLNFRMTCSFQILPSGDYVSAINKGDRNLHLGKYQNYKLLFSDTLGNIVKAAYSYPDTEYSHTAYKSLIRKEKEIQYFPLYLNQICIVTDSILTLKYEFDYSYFTPFEKEKLGKFESNEQFYEYEVRHTYLSDFVENDTHLFFKTNDNGGDHFFSFYDKKQRKIISFTSIYNDMDFTVEFNPMFSYQDYFVALVHPASLKALKQHIQETTYYPAKEENMRLFEQIDEEDNPVLVFFKVVDL